MGKISPLLLDSVEHETDIDLFLEQILRNIEIMIRRLVSDNRIGLHQRQQLSGMSGLRLGGPTHTLQAEELFVPIGRCEKTVSFHRETSLSSRGGTVNTDRFGTPQLTLQGESLFPDASATAERSASHPHANPSATFSICLTNVSAGYTERQSSSAS